MIDNELEESVDQNQDEGDVGSPKQNEYPPETYRLLSWGSLRFIRAPSSDFLMMSVIAIALTTIVILILSNLVEMDVTIKASGEVVSNLGSREAISPAAGQITSIRKKEGDKVDENEVIALLRIDELTEKNIVKTIDSLKEIEIQFRESPESIPNKFQLNNSINNSLEAGPALDAMITFEQQMKSFRDLTLRSNKGLENDLRPLKQRVALLKNKIKKMQESQQKQLLGMYVESTEEELGRIRSQISQTENEAKLKLEQGGGDLLKSIQSAQGVLDNYLYQHQIRSPIKGIISDVSMDVNMVIDVNKSLAKIIPENSQLMTAIHVFSKDVVKISSGQPILYKVEAYPYQTYGAFTGKVILFQQSKTPEKETANPLGDYVVYGTIEFPANLSQELKDKMRLIAGMKFNADIIVDRQSGTTMIKKMVFEKNK